MNDNDNGNTTTHPKIGKVLRSGHYRSCPFSRGWPCKCDEITQRRRVAVNKFQCRDKEVFLYSPDKPTEWVCSAKSRTYATRIMNALNEYQPDRRGQ